MTCELSGASRVVAVASVGAVFALVVVASFVLEQPAAKAAKRTIIKMQNFLDMLHPSSLGKTHNLFGKQRAMF
jgi:mannose/fructose/N-acetylgalactosamine-specific phosphotransferase system component IID